MIFNSVKNKLLFVFLLSCAALLAQPPVPGTPVQNASACLTTTTCSTAAQTHAAGTFLLATLQFNTTNSGQPTVTNTCGDTWKPLTQVGNGSVGFIASAYVLSSLGCSNDVATVAVGGSPIAILGIIVTPITGTAPNFPIDVGSSGHAVGGTDSSTSTLTTNAFTTRTANQVIFAVGCNINAPSSYTAGTGYTLIDTAPDLRMALENKSVTSIQTGATAQMSATVAAPPWLGDVISISSTDLPAPAWSITKSHIGNFTQGDYGDTYTVTVTNSGTASTDGTTVTMTETIPAQMGVISMSGTGWVCSLTTCTRSDVLAPSTSYPPIAVKVYVASGATSPKVNSVNVVGGGSSPTPVSTTDSTTILTGPSTITLTANPNFQWTGSGLTWATAIRQSGHISFPMEIDVSGAGMVSVGSCSSGNSCVDVFIRMCLAQPCQFSITSATAANPPVFTFTGANPLVAGETVSVSGFSGPSWNVENGSCVVSATALTATTMECATLNGSAPPSAVGFGAITGSPTFYKTIAAAPTAVFLGMDLENFPTGYNPGSHTAAYSITGSGGGTGTVNLSWTSIAYTNPSFASYSGTFTNCTSGGNQPNPGDLNICTFTTGQNYDVFTPPAAPSTYVDGNFGGVVKTLVAPPTPGNPERLMGGDSVTTQINSDNSLVITNILTGFQFATSTSTGADVYSNFTFCSAALTWSPTQPLVYSWINGVAIMKHTLPNNCSSDTTTYTYPGVAAGGLTNGGDGGVNKLNFWGLYTSGGDPSHPLTGHDQTALIVNLNTGIAYTGSFAGKPVTASGNNVRAATISKGVDVVTHKMYLMLQGYPDNAAEIYSLQFASDNVTVTGSALVDEGSMGMTEHSFLPGYNTNIENGPSCTFVGLPINECWNNSHGDTFEGGDGQQYWLGLAGTTGGAFLTGYSVSAAMRFSSCITGVTCAPMLVDVEGGGGAVETFNVCFNGDCGDIHQGCAVKAPVCVVGTDGDPAINETDISNAVTSGSNVNLTLTGTPSFTTGATVTVGGVNGNGTSTGCIRANGVWTNVTVSGPTVTLTGVTCDGSWIAPPVTAGSGIVSTFQTANPGSHQDELMLFDFTNISAKQLKVKRLVKSRAIQHNNSADSYYTQLHPVISMDGSLIVYGSNNNRPYSLGIFSTPTGFSAGSPPPSQSAQSVNAISIQAVK